MTELKRAYFTRKPARKRLFESLSGKKKKVKYSLKHAMKVQMGSRVIAQFFL
jgi:hypothetical protein